MSMSGATEFEVLPHAEHGTPDEMTLRAELWGEATGLNTGDDIQFNAGQINVVIQNVTQGAQVSLAATYSSFNDTLGYHGSEVNNGHLAAR